MRLTLDQLTNRIERLCDWYNDWERRFDVAVAKRWLADDELRRLEDEGELIRRKQMSLRHKIPGCLGMVVGAPRIRKQGNESERQRDRKRALLPA